MTRPLIAMALDRRLTSSEGWPDELTDALFAPYIDLIEAAGGVAVLAASTDATLAEAHRIVELVDGVVVAGGRDVDARTYGHDPHPANDPPLRARDRLEIALTLKAIDSGKPVLGICRGMQIINVALGGTLEQHLADRVDEPDMHLNGQFVDHYVNTIPGTRVWRDLGSSLNVPSHHHQAVATLGRGLRATAHAGDGVVEAIECTGSRFIVGVQWHPERRPASTGLSIVESFVTASRRTSAVVHGHQEV
ncbi:gamma-glutamyl-gamma-aminobutyrate hydrolase family protein [Modestobacter sp. VKM Ac-2978]|uniref:gamma-glutamyl-gamma-aminobutyrate hydrolase family protein n=1 Tax=Modestobacter sp. VKM Ac-2978 TaxID=3004132 RepID=UPI0022AAEE85|nr:gamma-glutamyl-gamma-aminobutyrate hydrolase family protein [Modestobacter sp. VKM Ac-2978]MCZ2849858.1 gamma-glutamyl-gamma-aminobutyrate hydrolase family protein [Modestobacter sp. VKM Ac-2978]